jgi:hypothetical protein
VGTLLGDARDLRVFEASRTERYRPPICQVKARTERSHKIRALVIDDQARAKARRIREFAEQPENWYLVDGSDRELKIPGNDPRRVAYLNTYRCVFSITKAPDGLYRHLSISVSFERTPKPLRCIHDCGIVWLRWMGREDRQAGPGLVNPSESC